MPPLTSVPLEPPPFREVLQIVAVAHCEDCADLVVAIARGRLDEVADVLGIFDRGRDSVLVPRLHVGSSGHRRVGLSSKSLKSIPRGGRAIRTWRPSSLQRRAASRA